MGDDSARRRQMRIQSVRFSDRMWSAIQDHARSEGVSASQYIREAVLARMVYEDAVHGGARYGQPDLYRVARELLGETEEED